jgi:PhoH-like ATPase
MEKKKIFVLDTNVIMHDSDCLLSFKEHDVAIPIEVIIELNDHKIGSDSVNFHSREALRKIESLPHKQIYDGGASLGENLGRLKIINFKYNGFVKSMFSEETMDHKIINAAYCLANNKNKKIKTSLIEVVFVSKDVALRLKSAGLGLISEDYKNDIVPDANALYKEVKKVETTDSIIDELYVKKILPYCEEIKLHENEFVILNSSKGKALACYKNEEIYLVNKDKLNPFGIYAKNAEQTFALSALLDNSISLVTLEGKAGTGKTLLALASGLQSLKDGKYDRIYFTREAMGVSNKEIGFLPGGVYDKLSPYMKGLYDNISVLKNINADNAKFIDDCINDGKLIIEPLTYIRGRSIPRTYFIVDESQNSTRHETKTIVTRAGEGTKIILIGDVTQIDTPYLDEASNGLSHVISAMTGQNIYAHIVMIKGERSYLAELAGNLL